MTDTHLVMLPGMLCDASLFDHQVEHLSEVAETSVGDLTKDDSIAGMALAVLDEAPERFALAGLSMGGIVAFEILRQAPDRVSRLALLDTNARPPSQQQLEVWEEFAGMVERGRFTEIVEEYLLPAYFHPDRADPELEKKARRMAETVGEETFLHQLSAQSQRPDSRESLREVSCPALVTTGRQDQLCPIEMSGEISSSIPDSNLVIVEDCGHLSTMEQPEAVTAVLRYWLEEAR